jgi:sporulation protein YlmC with PRC-barrel domain
MRLTDAEGYRLVHPDQDWRGWPVLDTSGTPMGRVADFIIDTDEGRAVSVLLNTTQQVPIDGLTVGDRHLVIATPLRSTGEPGPFERGTYDVMARAEEVVLTKRVKVVEELVIGREVIEHKERIRTSVRSLDVDVDKYRGQATPSGAQKGDRHGQ